MGKSPIELTNFCGNFRNFDLVNLERECLALALSLAVAVGCQCQANFIIGRASLGWFSARARAAIIVTIVGVATLELADFRVVTLESTVEACVISVIGCVILLFQIVNWFLLWYHNYNFGGEVDSLLKE